MTCLLRPNPIPVLKNFFMADTKSFGSIHTAPNGDKHIKTKLHGRTKWISYPRFVIEQASGFRLEHDEKVYHRDENKNNNDLSNLVVISMKRRTLWHIDPNTKNQILTSFYQWSRFHPHCKNKNCTTPDSKHASNGLCKTCDSREKRKIK